MTQPSPLFFDHSLHFLAQAVREVLGDKMFESGTVLRDASGHLRFFSPAAPDSEKQRERLLATVANALGPYARPDGAVEFAGDPGAQRVLDDPTKLPIEVDGLYCQLVDRRIVGSGWLDIPRDPTKGPPRIVFASVKGGVGRSSSLVVTAADLSRRGSNVLIIDLDLEAPGIGHLLLDRARTPRWGVADYLVESGISRIPDEVLDDFLGTSELTSGSSGRVDVIPAFGSESAKFPENVLPKLSRAMIEMVPPQGGTISVADHLFSMIERFSARDSYDVVLIDSRAGLAELAAPAILSLGATVLLFGTAQRQTIEGYRALFAGLKLLAIRDKIAGRSADWRLMFKSVYAKANLGTKDSTIAKRYRDDLYELFADYLYDAEEPAPEPGDWFNFSIDDSNAPHWPLVIPFNSGFIDFDPAVAPDQLSWEFYEATYRPFLNGIDVLIATNAIKRIPSSPPSV
jgi:cellulose biosynthesis protein BcsQ